MKIVNVKIKGMAPGLLQNRFDTTREVEKKVKLQRKGIDNLPTAEDKLYSNGDGIYVPNEWIEGAMKNASTSFKRGKGSYKKLISSMVSVEPEQIRIEPQDWVEDIRSAVNHNMRDARIIVVRPKFPKWSLEFQLMVEDDSLVDVAKEVLAEAGRTEGIGGFRPNKGGKFGKFEVIKYECN